MDYSGNDLPYIVGQEYVSVEPGGSLTITLDMLQVKDDDAKDNWKLIIEDGPWYSVFGDSIKTNSVFSGYLQIPVKIDDGRDVGQVFNFTLRVKEASVYPEQVLTNRTNSLVGAELKKMIAQLNKDLLGRFYDFRTEAIYFERNDSSFMNINLLARGTLTGEIRNQEIYHVVTQDEIDEDRDGFQWSVDCNDRNPDVNPGQIEIPYNGKDDDCDPTTPDNDLDGDGYTRATEL